MCGGVCWRVAARVAARGGAWRRVAARAARGGAWRRVAARGGAWRRSTACGAAPKIEDSRLPQLAARGCGTDRLYVPHDATSPYTHNHAPKPNQSQGGDDLHSSMLPHTHPVVCKEQMLRGDPQNSRNGIRYWDSRLPQLATRGCGTDRICLG